MAFPRLRYLVGGFLLLCVVGLSTVPAQGQEVRGVVLSDRDRSPVEFAAVKLTDLASGRTLTQLTNQRGAFSVTRAPGRVNVLEVSALGYQTHLDTVYLAAPEDSLTLEIRLGVDAIPLDPLVVVGSKRPIWESTQPKYLWEYFEREQFYSRLGAGRFYDREALDRWFGTGGSLKQLPTLYSAESYSEQTKGRHLRGRCDGDLYFLDGIQWRGNAIRPEGEERPDDPLREIPWGIGDLAAVEVYTDPVFIPAQFFSPAQITQSPPCRVMAIWTQRPVIPEGAEEEGRGLGWFLPALAFLGIALVFTAG